QESEQARHFALSLRCLLRGPHATGQPVWRRLPFQGTVYAIVGFRYKYTMSDTATHNSGHDGVPAEPAAELVAALGRRSVVLVGMMGAGKSSVGRRLAGRLGLPFVDADNEIEKAAGMTIAEIFTA